LGVLRKQRCPRTGVVNFFTSSEPLLAAGSIVEAARLRQAIARKSADHPRRRE